MSSAILAVYFAFSQIFWYLEPLLRQGCHVTFFIRYPLAYSNVTLSMHCRYVTLRHSGTKTDVV